MMYYMQWGMSPMQSMQWESSPMHFMYDEDERDEEYFENFHPESCKRIRPYVKRELDRLEGQESPLYDEYIDEKMLDKMGEKIYDRVTSEMPEMIEESDERQYGRRRFLRDIIGVLLLQNLLRRRRRRRRRWQDFYQDDFYNYY